MHSLGFYSPMDFDYSHSLHSWPMCFVVSQAHISLSIEDGLVLSSFSKILL